MAQLAGIMGSQATKAALTIVTEIQRWQSVLSTTGNSFRRSAARNDS